MSRKKTKDTMEAVAVVVEASSPKPKPALDGAIGRLTHGRFVQHIPALRGLIRGLSAEMVEIVAEIARHGDNEFARLAAANSLLDRDMGRATQYVETTERQERALDMSLLSPELREKMVEVLDTLETCPKLGEKLL